MFKIIERLFCMHLEWKKTTGKHPLFVYKDEYVCTNCGKTIYRTFDNRPVSYKIPTQ